MKCCNANRPSLAILCAFALIFCAASACKNRDVEVKFKRREDAFDLTPFSACVPENEVLTRQWLDPAGRLQTLLHFNVQAIEGRPTVAIAMYGDKFAGQTNYVDIYRHFLAVSGAPSRLFLLCHDYRPGRLANFNVKHANGRVFFTLVRHLPKTEKAGAWVNSYSYEYHRNGLIVEGMGDFYEGGASE